MVLASACLPLFSGEQTKRNWEGKRPQAVHCLLIMITRKHGVRDHTETPTLQGKPSQAHRSSRWHRFMDARWTATPRIQILLASTSFAVPHNSVPPAKNWLHKVPKERRKTEKRKTLAITIFQRHFRLFFTSSPPCGPCSKAPEKRRRQRCQQEANHGFRRNHRQAALQERMLLPHAFPSLRVQARF